MSDLAAVRKWSHPKRLEKLKQIREWLESESRDPEDRRVADALDMGVMILLETFASAKLDPMETYESLLSQRTGVAWDLLGMRFLDTQFLVARFKDSDKEGKLRLRSKLVARGMI